MLVCISELKELLQNYKILNKKMDEVIRRYNFYEISDNTDLEKNQQIITHFKESKVIIIDQFEKNKDKYFILSFQKTLVFVNQNSDLKKIIFTLFSNNSNLSICFLSNIKDIFDQYHEIQYVNIEKDREFEIELKSFDHQLSFNITRNQLEKYPTWEKIKSCISGYLIKQSYLKICVNRIETFYKEENHEFIEKKFIKEWQKEDFFELRQIGTGSISNAFLIYSIEEEEIAVIKKPNTNYNDIPKLYKREIENYKKIKNPLIPKFYGTVKNETSLIIEYIKGQTLYSVKKLSRKNKILIIYGIMEIINYFHDNKYVLRDIKPDNIIIDENNIVVMIDFDRMIEITSISKAIESKEFTKDFGSIFVDPETMKGHISYGNDIYSLGKIISFIKKIEETDINNSEIDYLKIDHIYEECMKELNQRKSIFSLIYSFLGTYFRQIQYSNYIYYISTQLLLSTIFYNGQYVSQDINKTIHYLTLAANHNNEIAQNNLGTIYYDGKYVSRDINKAIHYFLLAANQKYVISQKLLGMIFIQGEYVKRDIRKAIYYLSLAAEQNNLEAQYLLGCIFLIEEYCSLDITKGIHYLTLSADQNYVDAQLELANIYYDGKYVMRNINKAIHYFTKAADQNNENAQEYLGIIYYLGKYVQQDFKKAIHFFSLAADKNRPRSQNILGCMYYDGSIIEPDIKKAIQYLTKAADQNYMNAQYKLGKIYYSDENVKDINKATYYFQLASNQNDIESQFWLDFIKYNEENVGTKKDIKDIFYYMNLAMNQTNSHDQFYLDLIHSKCDLNVKNELIYFYKLAINYNLAEAQFIIGMFYYYNRYINQYANKAIYYFTLAANQNYDKAQVLLGSIYSDKQCNIKDISKSIYYYDLAANQNDPEIQFLIGSRYLKGVDIPQNINKAIHFFTLAAKSNLLESQFQLGYIYYEGKYVSRDINKSIYYFYLASDIKGRQPLHDLQYFNLLFKNSNTGAQFLLGYIYYENKYILRDINKSIHYFTLAANENHPVAQCYLGLIYHEGRFVSQNISKAMHYYFLAAEQNYEIAYFNLGLIYFEGKYIAQDINKAIHYFTLAANQNESESQYYLGIIYLSKNLINFNINKGINYLYLSSKNNFIQGHFALAYLFHEGKYMKRDILKAIHHYKEASSFNNPFSKNNLGIIYKYGFGDNVKQNLGWCIEYFKEAIHQKNDYLSIYNLSHIYLYNEQLQNFDKSIELLLSSKECFYYSDNLLCLSLIKKHGFNIKNILNELNKHQNKPNKIEIKIEQMIKTLNLFDENVFIYQYEFYKKIDFLYDHYCSPVVSYSIFTNDLQKKQTAENITKEFYEGFGNGS